MTTGTAGNDRLTNDRAMRNETIWALGGDDTIIIRAPEVEPVEPATIQVDGGDGYDTLLVGPDVIRGVTGTGDGGEIRLQSGNLMYTVTYDAIERLVLHGYLAEGTIQTGDTDDELHINGAAVMVDISSGAGNDRIYLTGTHSSANVIAWTGHDLVDFSGVTPTGTGEFYANGGDGNDTLIGSSGADRLEGGEENDYINGNAGDDYLTGGTGDDAIHGGAGQDWLLGNAGHDSLDGGAGADIMGGGTGNDTYMVDDRGDRIIESAGQGYDIVNSTVSYTLPDAYEIEVLNLVGNGALNANGNRYSNVLVGNEAANRLDGRGGDDIMDGRGGDDTYVVDSREDLVIEANGGGNDTILSSISIQLSEIYEVENVTLTGAAAINATGNSLNNVLIGNDAANTLDGGAGVDIMRGAGGNDTYIVDNSGDTVIETAGGGMDTVRSSVTFRLSDAYEVERLFLTGTANIDAFGNNMNNTLVGNSGNNVLNGRGGADIMNGGAGNDLYIVDNAGDRVIDEGGGNDTVQSYITYILSESYQIENLVLSGNDAINGFGNRFDNRITGNDADNRIGGGFGNDTLRGNGGADGFYFNTGLDSDTNVDRILDFVSADDTIWLDDAIFTAIPQGVLEANRFHVGTEAADAEDRIIYDQATGRIFYDEDGSGESALILFATVTPGTVLTAADFIAY